MRQLYDQVELDTEELLFDLQELGKKYNIKGVFVVSTDLYNITYLPQYFETLGWKDTLFSDFSPNPDYVQVCEGVKRFKESGAELIVAIGGGSSMDVAKSIKLYADMELGCDYMKQEQNPADVPLLAVPTTAGTGSDGNGNIVFYRDGVKQSLNHPKVAPNYILFEPKFLKGLPEYQKKSTLADAFCQCIESIWAKGANEESTEYAMEGLKLIYDNMLRYLRGDIECFPDIQKGAYLSGRAINISKTTAAHALSYKLSSDFKIAHGHAVLMMISPVTRSIEEYLIHKCGINSISVLEPPYDRPVEELSEEERKKIEDGPRYYTDEEGNVKEIPADTRELLEKLKKIMSIITPGKKSIRSLHKQISFVGRILDIKNPDYPGEEKLRELAGAVNVERLGNNPVSYTPDELTDLYIRAFNKIRIGTILDMYDRNPVRWAKSRAAFEERYKDDLSRDRIIDDPFYEKIRDRQNFVNGLQELTLETLLLTQKFLDEHGLRFYLAEGTLMGAARHHGFIPWDDDVDIMMPRHDYDKLVELDKKGLIPPELHFDSLENNPKHWVLGAKMQLTRKTNYIQKKVEDLSENCGPYVDIFPLDYWKERFTKKQYKADRVVKYCRRALFMKTGYSRTVKKSWKRKVFFFALPFFSNKWVEKLAIKNMTKWKDSSGTKFMVNLCSYYPFFKEVFPVSFFGDPIYLPFEGHMFPVPREYDFMLRTIYGSAYDSVPPVEVTNMRKHAFELSDDERNNEVGNSETTEKVSDERYEDYADNDKTKN